MPQSLTLKICLIAIAAGAAETGIAFGLGQGAAALFFLGVTMLLSLVTAAAYPSLSRTVGPQLSPVGLWQVGSEERPLPQAAKATSLINPSWATHAYPLQQLTIRLQGTRHSDKAAIIGQLEEVLARLNAGDVSGYEHDDDFGYWFEYVPASSGPSFFEESAGSK